MNAVLLKNGRFVLPETVTEPQNLLIRDEIISKIGAQSNGEESIDIKGGYVFPGFVDIHIHGGGGADFMDGTAEAFETAVKAHLKRGTTTMVPTAMTATHNELVSFINAYHSFKRYSGYSDAAVGLHLEGPYFSNTDKSSKGAQSGNLIRDISFSEIAELLDIANGSIIRWDAAPEIPNSAKFAEICKENNIICAAAHTNATAAEAQRGFEVGFSHITHFYNAVTAYKKRGQKVTAGVVEAAYLNDGVTLELICDGRHVPKECVQLALKIKGEKKVCGITDATRISCTDMKCGKLGSLKNGTEVIVDDGVAKLPDMSSYAGSICTMDRALKVLCIDYGVGILTASKMLSSNPAALINEENIGQIKEGFFADLVITDNNFNVKTVIKRGRVAE